MTEKFSNSDAELHTNLAWTAGGRLTSESLRVGGHLFLTRLLPPEAFGLFLLVNTFVHGLANFSDIGIGASIVQNRSGEAREFLDTAWTIQVARGVLLWLICCAGTPFVADFYGQPELLVLVPVGAASLIIASFTSPVLALLQRRLELKRWVMIDIAVQVMAVATMIFLAWWTQSVWALIAGTLVTVTARMVISHGLDRGYRPRFAWHSDAAMALIGFGFWILLNTPLGWLADNADRLAIGRLAPIDVVGVFYVAVMVGGLPFNLLSAVGANAVFPMFSRASRDAKGLRSLYAQVERPILIMGALAICGLVAVGPAAIEILLDPRWHGAAAMILPIAFSQWFRIAAIPPANALFALGYPQYLVLGNTAKIIGYLIFVPLSILAMSDGGSVVMPALWGFALGEAMAPLFYRFLLARKMPGYGWQEFKIGGLLLASGGFAYFGSQWLGGQGYSVILQGLFGSFVVAMFWGLPTFNGLRAILNIVLDNRRGRASA